MTRKPDDPNPEPPGGRAAERLREFLEKRLPEDALPPAAGGRMPDKGGRAEPTATTTDRSKSKKKS
jgi:hypothetical protein